MGCWNYIYADVDSNFNEDGTRYEDERYLKAIQYKDKFKLLIPKEFGGGSIIEKDGYDCYGDITDKKTGLVYDLYELQGIWNRPRKCKYDTKIQSVNDNTRYNREIGIDIGCYDKDLRKLKYPIKLVHVRYKGTYEDCKNISYTGQF